MSAGGVTDIAVIGGGINGAGIAADAAGRGLAVALLEAGDLAGATSSASSKLIHGGLRYLEHYDFRLVRESLAEREVLLAKAPHIIWPLRFVLPHVEGLRPRWMVRSGLLLYDYLYRRKAMPGSAAVDLARDPAGRPLKEAFRNGFAYWDCWVDDARLVLLNARAAADRGADVRTRTRVVSLGVDGELWRVGLGDGGIIRARAVVNAAGPWADKVDALAGRHGRNAEPVRLRLVKGSHIVVPRIAGANDAYLLQSPDRRVIFALPFEERFTIIGTTDVPFDGDPGEAAISSDEVTYLVDLARQFFKAAPMRSDIVWTYAGVRPLYDDQSTDPSAVTRDYRLDLAAGSGRPPLLSVYGGKLTTYRRLAEEALGLLRPHLPAMGPAWTVSGALPGGDMPAGNFRRFLTTLAAQHAGFDPAFLKTLARRHGTIASHIIGDARSMADMGTDLGAGLTEREVVHLKEREWARTPEDVLWRRTKAGLHLSAEERRAAEEAIARFL